MSENLYVQYGAGFSSPDGWRNFDASFTLYFERLPLIGQLYTKNKTRFPEGVEYGDIVKGLPLPKSSCAGIYCSHVLEHLSLQGFRTAINNTLLLLQPGGYFRLIVPDLEVLAHSYLSSDDEKAAIYFVKDTLMGLESCPKGIRHKLFSLLGHSEHLWMWDYKSLAAELHDAGFVDIRRCELGDCPDKMYELIEVADRFKGAVAIECKKA